MRPSKALYISALVGVLLIAFFNPALSLLLLALFSIFRSFTGSRSESLFISTHYTAIGIYFSLAASFQIQSRVEFWGGGAMTTSSIVEAILIGVLFCLGVELSYTSTKPFSPSTSHAPAQIIKSKSAKLAPIVFFLLFSGVASILILSKPSLNLEARSLQSLSDIRPLEVFLFSYFPKTLLWAAFSSSVVYVATNRRWRFVPISVLILFASYLLAGPETTPRQVLLIGAGPLIFFAAQHSVRFFSSLFIWIAVIGIGPIINYFARDQHTGAGTDVFPYSPDFDAVYVSVVIVDQFSDAALGLGKYLLSALSFFLPNEYKLFPDHDPLQSYFGNVFSQTNVSLPPFITAYLDFSYFGPIALGLAMGKIGKFIDARIISSRFNGTTPLFGYMLLCSYIPFIRGPILGWGPFLLSGIFAYFLVNVSFRVNRSHEKT